jgi:hypothetical protein
MFSFLQPLSHIVGKFYLDGKEYELEHFKVGFSQPTDYKGQPQHEVKGGQIMITLTHMSDNNLYEWAKRSTLRKAGRIEFQTEMSSPILRIEFAEAYCVSMERNIDSMKGSTTTLIIAPEQIFLNGLEHNNFWT